MAGLESKKYRQKSLEILLGSIKFVGQTGFCYGGSVH